MAQTYLTTTDQLVDGQKFRIIPKGTWNTWGDDTDWSRGEWYCEAQPPPKAKVETVQVPIDVALSASAGNPDGMSELYALVTSR